MLLYFLVSIISRVKMHSGVFSNGRNKFLNEIKTINDQSITKIWGLLDFFRNEDELF